MKLYGLSENCSETVKKKMRDSKVEDIEDYIKRTYEYEVELMEEYLREQKGQKN